MPFEYIDRALLKSYIDAWESLPWTRSRDYLEQGKKDAIEIYEHTDNQGHHPIEMKFERTPFKTREYAHGASLQKLMREVRGAICRNYYHDYDIVNCHATILLHLAKGENLPHLHLEDYCQNRKEWIEEGMSIFKCSYDDIKQQVTFAIDGGMMPYITNRYAALWYEVKQIQEALWKHKDYGIVREYVEQKKNDNQIGSFMALLLQLYEATILDRAIEYLQIKKINTDSLVKIFDGFMLDQKQKINLEEMNTFIEDKTGLSIQFIQKPMLTFQLPSKPTVGNKVILKLKPPPIPSSKGRIDMKYVLTLTIKVTGEDGETHIEVDEVRTVKYLNQFLKYVNIGKPFIIEITDEVRKGYIFHQRVKGLRDDRFSPIYGFFMKWLNSVERCTVTDVVFTPYLSEPKVIPSNEFNLFRGFKHTKHQPYDPNFKVNMELVEPWLDLIRHNWCDDVEKNYDYTIKWFASKIQRPTEKLLSTIIITSLLEGIGKNTFFDFFNHRVLGSEFGLTVGSMEELLSKFNDQFEMALIVCCDELKGRGIGKDSRFEHTEALKKLLTQKYRNIEAKFMATRTNCPDHCNYIAFTNQWGVMNPSMSDRRLFFMEGNVDRTNIQAYWANLYRYHTEEAGLHFFYYLAQLNLEEYNSADIPMTQWKRDMKEKNVEPIVRSVCNYIALNHDDIEPKFIPCADLYNLYLNLKGSFKHDRIRYSVHLCKMVGLESTRSKIDGVMKRGYKTSVPMLMERVRNILKDPEYPFELMGEDGNLIKGTSMIDDM